MKKKPLRVVFVGFGHVARKMASMLTAEREKFPGLSGLELEPLAIFTGKHGALVDPSGIDLGKALAQYEENGAFPKASMTVLQALETLDYDVLVELSALDIARRGEPAIAHVRAALERGRHAVTANKGPAAFAYRELKNLAEKNKVYFLFESAVMDGTPIFGLPRILPGCRVAGFSGILNTTTNFVISRLEQGESMDSAVKTAQRLGFAEADPSLDLEGWDAAAKTAILANVFMDAGMTPLQVERRGIVGLTATEAGRARDRGRCLKLICRGWLDNGKVRAGVSLEEVPWGEFFAAVGGKGSCLRIETDMLGPIMINQEKPTLYDTASGVLFDLLTAAAQG
ncbi:MAG: homoserine dehydrogenase [Candidatus Aminicenantes bacterium]|nr:homoserine dehydrogenase [Candidatus Aminicenantes bacterium]